MWALGCVALELLTGRDWFEEFWLQHYHASDGKVDRLRRKLGPATAAAATVTAAAATASNINAEEFVKETSNSPSLMGIKV